jgi:hypothetical protein
MTRTYLVIGLALGAAACAADPASMVILRNQVPGDDCTISSSQTAPFRGRGVMDPDSGGYIFSPVILSRIESSRQAERLIFLEGADVSLDRVDGDAVTEVAAFTTPFSGSITPGGSLGLAFEISPPALAEGNYLAHVQIFGSLEGGDAASQVFDYPFSVEPLQIDLGSCADLKANFVADSPNSCNPLQDGTVECCDTGEGYICPAEGPKE